MLGVGSRVSRTGAWVVALTLATCGGEGAGLGGTATGAGGGGVDRAAALPPASCGSSAPAEGALRDSSFELRATPAGTYAPGQEASFEIALEGRGSYHVNTEYPIAIHLRGPEDVALPRSELGKADAAEFGPPRARFRVPFRAQAPGRHRVTAEVDFAVCSAESCIPDCRLVAVVLPVEGASAGPAGAGLGAVSAPRTATP